ncbi:hypothetical protein ACFWA4_38540 [Streptomyces sp. NPDC060011]|uniref:hypothetical protein n=1 Tax=Streptomyces sp. NPDC060011 TaxID=3347037 RepID=UPI0036798306
MVRRAWIVQYTGAAESTVSRWYTERGRRPERLRHPEVVCTVGRTVYFDKEAVEAFWTAWQEDVGTRRSGTGRIAADGQGTRGGGPGRAGRDRAVALALEALRASGSRRGLAAELAREHGGVARSWQRAVAEARTVWESEQRAQDAVAPPTDAQDDQPTQSAP